MNEPWFAETTEREPSGYIPEESRWENYVSVTGGTFPTFWNFYTAFNTVCAKSDYVFKFTNDQYVGTDEFTCEELWNKLVEVWNGSHCIDVSEDETEAEQRWVSDVLGKLGWEWE
jgi:hypothetical protein